jgi:hypothetical protein
MSNAVDKTHNPLDDGMTEINVYTKGRTRLGRLLTNLSDLPVNHPVYGMFRTAEGLWYYLKTGCKHESLRAMSGFDAKKFGNTLEVVWNQDFKEQFLIGVRAKVMDNEELKELLRGSDMPFVHYYYFGSPYADKPPKVICPRDSDWQMEFFEELRRELKQVA